MNTVTHPVLTIGYSTHSFDAFMALVRKHGVTAIADVRSAPYSRFNPRFNKETLAERVPGYGMRYVFLGRELGARSEDPWCYENGRIQYRRLASTPLFRSGIERVMQGANQHHLALMCAEKEPLECHRTLLVAQALAERGVVVAHILADGGLESHEATMDRLLDIVGLPRQELFRSKEELLAEAIARQEERVAYVDERLHASGSGEAT